MLTGVKFYGFIFVVFYFFYSFFSPGTCVADQGPSAKSAKIKHCTIKVLESIQRSSFARECHWLEFILCLIVICSS